MLSQSWLPYWISTGAGRPRVVASVAALTAYEYAFLNCPSWMACCFVSMKEDLPLRVETGASESKESLRRRSRLNTRAASPFQGQKTVHKILLLCCLNTLPLHSSLAGNLLLRKALSNPHGHTASMQPPAHKKLFEGTPYNAQLHTLEKRQWHWKLIIPLWNKEGKRNPYSQRPLALTIRCSDLATDLLACRSLRPHLWTSCTMLPSFQRQRTTSRMIPCQLEETSCPPNSRLYCQWTSRTKISWPDFQPHSHLWTLCFANRFPISALAWGEKLSPRLRQSYHDMNAMLHKSHGTLSRHHVQRKPSWKNRQ